MNWLLNGKLPSLWVYARLLLLLGVLSIIAGVGNAVSLTWMILGESKGGIDMPKAYSLNAVFAALSFSTAAAMFLVGSAVVRFLAAKEDRERAQAVVNPALPMG
jgi:hypothetical protein